MKEQKYTKAMLGAELILKLEKLEEFSTDSIARWADHLRVQHMGNTTPEVDDIIQDLSAMSFGPEFEMTLEELKKLALDLIKNA